MPGEKVLIVVSTCEGGRPYLWDTLESLERAGALEYERRLLIDDFGFSAERPGWPIVFTRPEPTSEPSSRHNLWGAFRLALEKGATRLLFFEDDVLACKNAVHRMATVPIAADVAMVNFHDVKEVSPGSAPGLYRRHVRGRDSHGIWGIQALVLPRRTLEYLVTCDPFGVRVTSKQHHGDRTLEHYLSLSSTPSYAVHIPCLVKHVGEISVAHPGKSLTKRQTSNWPGVDYDAMGSISTILVR